MCLNLFYREHKKSMIRLKKLLPDSAKNHRGRRIVLNIQITIVGWLIEVFGFLTIVVGKYILGHENGIVTLTMQTFTMVLYGILLPCSILVSGSESKGYIAESNWYFRLINWFGCQPEVYSTSSEEEEEAGHAANIDGDQQGNESESNSIRDDENHRNTPQFGEHIERSMDQHDNNSRRTRNSRGRSTDLEIEDLETAHEI